MEHKHFSHDHHLSLQENLDNHSKFLCHACQQETLESDLYFCTVCTEFLCAESARLIELPIHPQHHLNLIPSPPFPSNVSVCNACQKVREWFTYHCFVCKFSLCLNCAIEPQRSYCCSHEHELVLKNRESNFFCDASGTTSTDPSYVCPKCPFWIHKACASSPLFIDDIYYHNLRLVLKFSVPVKFANFTISCNICKQEVKPHYWFYCCVECTYFVRMTCICEDKSGVDSGTEVSELLGELGCILDSA